jgi:hypothetical protein
VKLRVGEALLFSPSAIVGLEEGKISRLRMLGASYMEVRVRQRLTAEGGKSVMAG